MEASLNFNVVLEGRAAELVINKMSEYPKTNKGRSIGKKRATQLLLCELWQLKTNSDKSCE